MKTGPKPKPAICPHGGKQHALGKCKLCYMAAKAREYYPTRGRNQHFLRQYGLTVEQVDAAIRVLGSRCEICGKEAKLHIDHDHVRGIVRGMLCGSCNRGIGLLKDSPEVLESAAAYLRTTMKGNQ
jgi:hypothetical protein